MNHRFAYTDEDDKCYGITGMVISLNVFDSDSMLQAINLDNEEGEYITFTPDFYFYSNPRFSAKTAWNEMLHQYQLFTALVMGNIICRYAVGKRKSLSRDAIREIRRMVEEDGRESCALESDEIDTVFDKTLSYLSRIYGNRGIYGVAASLADTIKKRRSLTGAEVLDELQHLRQ